jgi:hypothetical protein
MKLHNFLSFSYHLTGQASKNIKKIEATGFAEKK